MLLKTFIWHNPTTQEPEKVYQFPWSEASKHEISQFGRSMFTSQPMQRPIMNIPDVYLTEIKGQGYSVSLEELKNSKLQAKHF